MADGCVFALENWNPKNKNAPKDEDGNSFQWLNIGTGKEISIKDLAIKIAEIFKYEGEIIWDLNKPDGTPRKRLNISKIKSLGWSPKIKLDEGLFQTIQNYEVSFKRRNE